MQKNIQVIATIDHSFLWGLYKFFIFFVLIVSFKAWFTWGIDDFYGSVVFISVCLLFFIGIPQWFIHRIPWLWFFLLILTLITGALYSSDIAALIHIVAPVLPLFFILALRSDYKEDLLSYISKLMAILIGISLAGWLLYLFGVQLPWFPIGYGNSDINDFQYMYQNHIFFLRNITLATDTYGIPRFSAVFVEPGYLGCLLSMFLLVNNFKVNKENGVFLVALLLTISLAGYIVFAVSLLLSSFKHSKKIFKYILGVTILILMVYLFGLYYNDGDNPIKKSIIDRLEYDKTEQTIVGYNRSREETDYFFWNQFVTSDKLLLGDHKSALSGDVDWKTYIISHGLISFLFFIGFLSYPVVHYKRSRLDCMIVSITYALIFMSTIHLAISMMYLSLFILGINRINEKKRVNFC